MATPWKDSPVLTAIKAYIDDLHGGNVRAASRDFGVGYETVLAWYKGRSTPKLTTLANTLEVLKASGKLQQSGAPNKMHQRAFEDFEFIPRAIAVAGCGESFQTEDGLQSLYAFRKEFLRREGIHAKDALMMYVTGDSMQPTIMDKDTILIDKADNEPRDGYIYVLSLGGALMVKRLQRIANGWLLRSDNERYAPVSVQGQELETMVIHGRVRWYSRVI